MTLELVECSEVAVDVGTQGFPALAAGPVDMV